MILTGHLSSWQTETGAQQGGSVSECCSRMELLNVMKVCEMHARGLVTSAEDETLTLSLLPVLRNNQSVYQENVCPGSAWVHPAIIRVTWRLPNIPQTLLTGSEILFTNQCLRLHEEYTCTINHSFIMTAIWACAKIWIYKNNMWTRDALPLRMCTFCWTEL